MSTVALDRLLISLKMSRTGFLSCDGGIICDGASRSCSTCFPGNDMIFGPLEKPEGTNNEGPFLVSTFTVFQGVNIPEG
jgi:hypothetical protein